MLLQTFRIYLPALVRPVLVLVLAIFPYFQYSRAHLHFVNGTVIVHWHPLRNQAGALPVNYPWKTKHNHSLADLLQLKAVQPGNGLPEIEYQVSFVYEFVRNLSPFKEIILSDIHIRIPTGRSPPLQLSS